MIDKLDLNTKAQELREVLGEDANSPVDIFSLVNQIEDLTLVMYPLGDNISGMCMKDDYIKLIAINSTMSQGRQRFSLAHELYHLYYDDESVFSVCSKRFDHQQENEKCAEQFASYFLAPYKALKAAIKRIAGSNRLTFEQVIYLEQHFGMSHLAMLWRLVTDKYLSIQEKEEFSHGVISEARSLGYDVKLYRPSPISFQCRTFGNYLKQVEQLRKRELVSPGKIDELLIDAYREDIAFGEDDDNLGGEALD